MKILIFSWRGPHHPNAGGAELSTHEHAKRWVKAGHSVTLFTSYYQGAKRIEQIDGVTIIRRGRQFFGVQWESFKWYLYGDHIKYDLIIDQFHGIPFFTPLYVREKKLAFIHEVTKEVWGLNPLPSPFNLIAACIGIIFEPLVFKLLYKNIPFMTVSESTKADLINWGIPETNVTVIHNGVSTLLIKNHVQKEKKKTLIFLGALAKDKGVKEAIEVFSILDRLDHNFQFWVVGKGDSRYIKLLQDKCRNLQIDEKVHFWGFVTEVKKFELLKKAHILINPSIREGWGLVVIEAASVGTPAAAFNVQGLKDSIVNDKTGILCQGTSAQELAEAILGLLKNNKKYQKMCQSAVAWSKMFSWNKASNESLRLLNDLLKGSKDVK